MSHFELQLALEKAVNVANKTVQEGGYLTGEEILAMFIEAGEKVDYEKKPPIVVGNDYVGDISGLDKICTITKIEMNWIHGHSGNFKFSAKIFSEDSTYGIKDGRISKLQICDTSQSHWGREETYVHYERGWDIYPTTDEAVAFLNLMLEALGDDVMTDEDLIYYQIYLYDTVKDFEDMNSSDNFGAYSSISDARESAEDFPEYERIKIVSSDGEEIDIIENEPVEDDE